MKAIAIKTWNKKGSVESYKEGFGMATIGSEDYTYFKIDRFEGYGDTYKEREEPNYEIMIDGKILFSGNKEELKKKLIS